MMHKRVTKSLLALGVLVVTGAAYAGNSSQYSQKNFMAIRPHGVNTAMEYTGWNRHAYKKQAPTIHSHFQATAFYQKSQKSSAIGRYFGIGNGKNSFTVGQRFANNGTTLLADPKDVENGYLIHDSQHQNDVKTLTGNVVFDPYQEAYGLRLDYFQHINHPFSNFFFKASLPFEHVAHSMKMKVLGSATVQPDATSASYSIDDFFRGKVNIATTGSQNLQSPLTKGKIVGHRTLTGPADIDFGLGYKYFQGDKHHCFFSVDFVVPTGNRVRSDYLFEPVYGNGRHFGMGASLDIGFQLWKSDRCDFRLLWPTRYRYLFEGTENRMLGISDASKKLDHYYLARPVIAPDGLTAPRNISLFPLANQLVYPFAVKPGSMLDTSLDFAFSCKRFSIDLGYNLFWKDRETVHIKSFDSTAFDNQKLGIVTPNYGTGADLTIANNLYKSITTSTLNFDAVVTPALFTHKLFAGLGYSYSIYKTYVGSVGIGGSYEFATSNADLENYALWAKAGFSF